MKELSATEAARRFSAVLDAVEHRNETFVIFRQGRAVATLGPASGTSGARVKEILRAHPRDPDWADELAALRSMLLTDERTWRG
ncbi:MAG: type II toxin-antitoxin system Phd/YefM family antitoxin [Gaiellaceae bacterium]